MSSTVDRAVPVPGGPERLIPGYIAHRIQQPIGAEVFAASRRGDRRARDIDDAIIHGRFLRNPILGHLAKADFNGLQLKMRARQRELHAAPTDALRNAQRPLRRSRTGVMAGRGYIDWGGRDPAALFRERDCSSRPLRRRWPGSVG